MRVELTPGTYVLAISGGVDSMALLHAVVANQTKHRYIVAHFDHGIRSDSHLDRRLVAEQAARYQLPFVYGEGNLGPAASEAEARNARYAFLESVRAAAAARAIVTAHHADDVLETAVLNVRRGTGRKGLTSLRNTSSYQRPLLDMTKSALIAYAQDQGLTWREDSTNVDTRYARNYVRHKVLAQLSEAQKSQLHEHLGTMRHLNDQIDLQLLHILHLQDAHHQLSRNLLIRMPHVVARELIAAWLRNNGVRNFDSKTLERLVMSAKTMPKGRRVPVIKGWVLVNNGDNLALEYVDRQK